mgnify:CR=1 FL=1|jgi:hypothetical protein
MDHFGRGSFDQTPATSSAIYYSFSNSFSISSSTFGDTLLPHSLRRSAQVLPHRSFLLAEAEPTWLCRCQI